MDYEQHKDLADLSWSLRLVEPYCHPRLPEWPTIEAYWDVVLVRSAGDVNSVLANEGFGSCMPVNWPEEATSIMARNAPYLADRTRKPLLRLRCLPSERSDHLHDTHQRRDELHEVPPEVH